MRIANQLTFTTYEASLKLKPNDPTKIVFDRIDWSFIHSLDLITLGRPELQEHY